MTGPKGAESLAAALAAFQAELPHIGKDNLAVVKSDKGSYKYTYADLSDVSAVVLPAMARHGLSFSAKPTLDDADRFVLEYTLRHVGGEADVGRYPLPATGTAQQVGSAITYARRYALCAVAGVAPDEDDDGAGAEQAQRQHVQHPHEHPELSPADQARDDLRQVCAESGWDPRIVATRFATQYGEPLRDATDPIRIEAFRKLLYGVPGDELKAPQAASGAQQ